MARKKKPLIGQAAILRRCREIEQERKTLRYRIKHRIKHHADGVGMAMVFGLGPIIGKVRTTFGI